MKKQRESPFAGLSWHMNLSMKKFQEILLIKGGSALLYPLLARAQTLPCCCFHPRLWKAAALSIHPAGSEIHPSASLVNLGALPSPSSSSKICCSFRVNFFPPCRCCKSHKSLVTFDLQQRQGHPYNEKKTRSIFSDTKTQFIIEINDTFILYRDEVSILQQNYQRGFLLFLSFKSLLQVLQQLKTKL